MGGVYGVKTRLGIHLGPFSCNAQWARERLLLFLEYHDIFLWAVPSIASYSLSPVAGVFRGGCFANRLNDCPITLRKGSIGPLRSFPL